MSRDRETRRYPVDTFDAIAEAARHDAVEVEREAFDAYHADVPVENRITLSQFEREGYDSVLHWPTRRFWVTRKEEA